MKTAHKHKLARHLSYPLGVERLATALGSVPQADEMTVSFHAHHGGAAESERRRREGEYYPPLVASFDHMRLGLSECTEMRERGLYDPHWNITVYAVSRTSRAVASRLLSEIGLPAVAEWLRTPRSETWLQGHKAIVISFNERDETMIVESVAE